MQKHFDITLIVNSPQNPSFRKIVKVKIIHLNILRRISLIHDIKCLFILAFIFIKYRPNAVHSITPKAGLLAMLASFLTFVPFRIHTFTGQVWASKSGFFRQFLKLIDVLISHLSSVNIIDSHSQKIFLLNEGVIKDSKSIVFGYGSVSGVNLRKFRKSFSNFRNVRQKLNIPLEAFVFIYLGRLCTDKGVLDLAQAFSQISDSNAYLIYVGKDEEGLTQKIKFINKDKLEMIRFAEFTNSPQAYLSASNVLCLPSYREGFGTVIIEAAAMGVPAIASNIYGISDAIISNRTGILHKQKNIQSILNCLNVFLSEPLKSKRLGINARKRVIKYFDADLISYYWLNFYLELF